MIPARMVIAAALRAKLGHVQDMRRHVDENGPRLSPAQLENCAEHIRKLAEEARELSDAADRLTD